MPRYNFKCKECNVVSKIRVSSQDINTLVELCKVCNKEMFQVIGNMNSNVSMSPEQKEAKKNADVKKILDEIGKGNQTVISEIFGNER